MATDRNIVTSVDLVPQDDIRTLDNDVPAALKEQYFQRLQEL